ncbi:MAG: YkgJ family cysteine cluster protein [Thermocladium sp.]|jgi:Fe-S-cluster containining protein
MGFKCLFCDKCCYFSGEEQCPIVFPDEAEKLRDLAAKVGASIKLKELRVNGARMYRWIIDGYCPFYDRDKRICTIHNEKPLACRMYPLLYNPRTGEVIISRDCPWVNDNPTKLTLDNFINEAKAVEEVIWRIHKVKIELVKK